MAPLISSTNPGFEAGHRQALAEVQVSSNPYALTQPSILTLPVTPTVPMPRPYLDILLKEVVIHLQSSTDQASMSSSPKP